MRGSIFRPLHRGIERFMAEPASARNAARLIIVATILVVLVGSVVVYLFDRRDFPHYDDALWFTLQTATTVGYGDVVPESILGRIVGGFVMLTAIALLTIVTAAVTSVFIDAVRRSQETRHPALADDRERLAETLDEIAVRLARIEKTLGMDGKAGPD